LPNILWFELVNENTHWLFWAKLGLLAALTAASLFWNGLKPLRKFVLILFFIYALEEASAQLANLAVWQNWFGSGDASFEVNMFGVQLRRLLVSILMVGVMLVLGYSRRQMFLQRGDLKAPIEPVRWLGFPKPDPWTRFGGQFAIYISLGTLLFLVIGGRPSGSQLLGLIPMLPAVLLFAAMNAFNEEFTYRSTLLAGLESVTGARQAVLIAAAFFGLGHYFGVPYGIIGVLMASFLGWMMGKAMIETRGFFWAWFIHFLQDVMIFSFMAMGSIRPGG
jgi:hypothetical protein